MADLKLYLDQVTSAQANLETIKNQIDVALQLGTPEGAEQALAMESQLDEAIAKRDQAEQFYNKMVTAMKSSDLLKNFVPVSETPTTTEEPSMPNLVNLSAWNKMTPRERLAFAKAGGKLED
jgi:hypothetical protein